MRTSSRLARIARGQIMALITLIVMLFTKFSK